MYYPQTLPEEYSVHTTPDGFCICGPHAQTAEGNKQGGTVSSIYLIVRDSFACVVDTGRFDACYKKLAGLLKSHKLSLKYIILTHDHYDHVGNAERLRKEFGGEIIAHALDAPLIRDPLSIYDAVKMQQSYGASLHEAWRDMGISEEKIVTMRAGMEEYFTVPVSVDRYICNEEIVFLKDLALHLLHTPGHSPGSLSVHVPSSNSVYTGDLTFWVNPCRPYPLGNAANCLMSLQRIRDLVPQYCGHGHYRGVEKPVPWLDTLIERHRALRHDILLLLEEAHSVAQLRAKLFPVDPFDAFAPIPENSIQAVLVSLLQDTLVLRQLQDNVVFWHKIVE